MPEYLAGWGLRSFTSEALYYEWQRRVLPRDQLQRLTDLAQKRQGENGTMWDQAFYDLLASPDLLPVLYSQRYGYYEKVGIAMARQLRALPKGVSVLDVGCGVGILTIWYASSFPHIRFHGIDRSSKSVGAAKRHAEKLQVTNVEFTCEVLSQNMRIGHYEGIIATQSLFQSELDPGLPSQTWRTFERAQDVPLQLVAEERTGLGGRLDGLLPNLKHHGILWLLEKTLHLGRRMLFQRALMRRNFGQLQPPAYLQFSNLGEVEIEGPLFVVSREKPWVATWDEAPRTTPLDGVYRCGGEAAQFISSRFFGTMNQRLWAGRLNGRTVAAIVSPMIGGLFLGCLLEGSAVRGVLVGASQDEGLIQEWLGRLHVRLSQPESFEQLCAFLWPTQVDLGPLELLPIYENHTPLAQRVWSHLGDRHPIQSKTFEARGGKARFIELGTCVDGCVYVYWANTFDQRQLVMIEGARKFVLEEYFHESMSEPP